MKKLFNIQLRGYNPTDVNNFIKNTNSKEQMLKDKLSRVVAKNKHLNKLVANNKIKQNSIGKSLVMSEQLSQKVLDNAHKQGGEYLEHAQAKAQNVVKVSKSNAKSVMSVAHAQAQKLLSDTEQKKQVLLKNNLSMYHSIQKFRKDISTQLLHAFKQFSAPLRKELDAKDRRLLAYDEINLANQRSRRRILNQRPTNAIIEAKNPSAVKVYYPNGKEKSLHD